MQRLLLIGIIGIVLLTLVFFLATRFGRIPEEVLTEDPASTQEVIAYEEVGLNLPGNCTPREDLTNAQIQGLIDTASLFYSDEISIDIPYLCTWESAQYFLSYPDQTAEDTTCVYSDIIVVPESGIAQKVTLGEGSPLCESSLFLFGDPVAQEQSDGSDASASVPVLGIAATDLDSVTYQLLTLNLSQITLQNEGLCQQGDLGDDISTQNSTTCQQTREVFGAFFSFSR